MRQYGREIHTSALALLMFSSQGAGAATPATRPATGPSSAPGKTRVFVGTYTTAANGSKGIYTLLLDVRSGELTPPVLAGAMRNPSFLAINRTGTHLYAVGEVTHTGEVAAFAISPQGSLSPLNQQPSGGSGPCYIALDEVSRHAFVANYSDGHVAAMPIDADGRLGAPTSIVRHQGSSRDPKRQAGPHAHSIRPDPSGRFVLAADLGIDQVIIYRLDPTKGTLTPAEGSPMRSHPGSGPRHTAFHPSARFVYVANELSSTVTACAFDASRGALQEIQTISMLPADFHETSYAADVHVHPSGRFLYASNRGHDSIAIFAIDGDTGKLAARGHASTRGKFPRSFAIDPTGGWLIAANQNSDSLSVFRIDAEDGTLTPAGDTIRMPSPVCVKCVIPTR